MYRGVRRSAARALHFQPIFRLLHVNLVFGSQTGNAAYFASQLAEQLEQTCGHTVTLSALDDVDVRNVLDDHQSPLVVVCSVFGEGEPPDNAKKFVAALEAPTVQPACKGGDFCVMGLGDSRYAMERFNVIGKRLDQRLEQLGRRRLIPFVPGDVADDVEAAFDRFASQVLAKLPPQLNTTNNNNNNTPSDAPKQKVDEVVLVEAPAPDAPRVYYRSFDPAVYHEDNPRTLQCAAKRIVSRPGERVVAELLFREAGDYSTGDYLAVYPENPRATVDAVLKRCDLDPNQWFSLRGFQSAICMRRKTFPNPCSVRDFLSRFCDLRRPLPKESVKKLQQHVSAVAESSRIAAALENRDAFVKEFHFKSLDVLLDELPSAKLGLADLVDILPGVRPLFYSIASSRLVEPDVLRLVVAHHHILGAAKTPMMEGLVSTYLTRDIEPGCSVEAVVKPSLFRLPKDPRAPIIMIGVGSGIAPFLGFMRERCATGGVANHFYYGVLNEANLLYAEQLEEWKRAGVLNLHVAFGSQGVFAQHLMRRQSEELWPLIRDKQAHIYICGHTMLGEGVDLWLREVISANIKDPVEAKSFYDMLYEQGRYRSDVFA